MKLLICGGGNGAHVLAAIASSRNIETRVLTLYQNEAEVWNKSLQEQPLQCYMPSESGEETVLTSSPHCVSDKPEDVVPGVEVILISAPAFSHQIYLTAIEPYITSPAVIVGYPGQPGFEFQLCSIFKNKMSLISIMSTATLPFACRILEYGSKVKVHGVKKTLTVSVIYKNASVFPDPLKDVQRVLGDLLVLDPTKHFLENTLMFAVVHPALIYGKWKDWDGVPIKEKPLFYQGIDDIQAKYVIDMDDEILKVADEIGRRRPTFDMSGCISIHQWVVNLYGSNIADPTDLQTALRTNKAYDGLVHPMMSVEGGYVPDLKYRYLSEDIPYGLVVVKGLALLLGLDTPVTDVVILWGQEKLGKEYLVGGKLVGKDMRETRAPQVFGINSLEKFNDFLDSLIEK